MYLFFHSSSLLLQVCLDCKVTTEKELDTVEVLKAIQKAKEVKDRKSSGDKKVRSVTLNHTDQTCSDLFMWLNCQYLCRLCCHTVCTSKIIKYFRNVRS